MNITVNRAALKSALALATSVADHRNTISTLACALLRADKSLTVAASDLSTAYVSEIECSTKEPGALALDAKGLYDIISSLTSDDVTIRAVDGKGEIRAGKSRFQVSARPTADFPQMPDPSALSFAPFDSKMLARLVAGIDFCSDPADSNLAFQGIYVDFAAGMVLSASRVRCGMFVASLGSATGKALLSHGALATMFKVAGDDSAVAVSNGEIFVRSGRTVIASKLIEAEFPTAKDEVRTAYFRTSSDHDVVVPRAAFADTVRRVALVTAKELHHDVRISVTKGRASLSARGASGIAEDEIAVGYDGAGLEFALSANQVAEALDAMTSDEVTIGFSNNKFEPVMIRPTSEEMGEEHAILVMPVVRD